MLCHLVLGVCQQAKAKILVVRDIERDDIEFISKTLNCLPIAHVDHMSADKLGHADQVAESSVRRHSHTPSGIADAMLHEAVVIPHHRTRFSVTLRSSQPSVVNISWLAIESQPAVHEWAPGSFLGGAFMLSETPTVLQPHSLLHWFLCGACCVIAPGSWML